MTKGSRSRTPTAECGVRLLWACVVILYVGWFGYFAWQAPGGDWNNRVYDVEMWENHDPGGWYLSSAHEFFSHEQAPLYVGHPGLTLQVALRGLQVGLYLFRTGAARQLDMTAFLAERIYGVWFAAGLLSLALHLIGFLLVYRFARCLLPGRLPAHLAALLYATSLPVLFYLVRVSVEPVLVLLVLGTFLAAWHALGVKALPSGGLRHAATWGAVAGACAISAVYTKLHLAFNLPAVLLLLLVFGGGERFAVLPRRDGVRLPAALGALVAMLVLGAVWNACINWENFRAVWAGVATHDAEANVAQVAGGIRATLTGVVSQLSPRMLLPAMTRSNLFFFCEFGLLILALAGAVRMLLTPGGERAKTLWFGIYGAVPAVVWLYRAGVTDFHGFHYLFPVMPLVGVLGAAAVTPLLRGDISSGVSGGWRQAVVVGLVALVIHHVPMWVVLNSKVQDVRLFRARDAAYRAALSATPSNSRVGVDRLLLEAGDAAGIVIEPFQPRGTTSRLVNRLRERFVPVPSGLTPAERSEWTRVNSVAGVIENREGVAAFVPIEGP